MKAEKPPDNLFQFRRLKWGDPKKLPVLPQAPRARTMPPAMDVLLWLIAAAIGFAVVYVLVA